MFYIADLEPEEDSDRLMVELQELGFENLIVIEENSGTQLIGSYADGEPPELPGLGPWQAYEMDEVDWEQQWREHVPGYDGETLAITCNGQVIKLAAGAGFGDATHPTTQLMLEMMPDSVAGAHVFDLGCGSGILSLAAAACGAKSVLGMDIDPAAIQHAEENLALNPWAEGVRFTTQADLEFEQPTVLLLNMIPSEQELALRAHPKLQEKLSDILISGVLADYRDAYLENCPWQIISEISRDGWLALHCR